DAAGQGAIFEAARAEAVLTVLGDPAATSSATATRSFDDGTAPRLEELASRSPVEDADQPIPAARPDRRRATGLPTVAADLSPGSARSRFDEDLGVVLYNEGHPDYLNVEDDEGLLLDYL